MITIAYGGEVLEVADGSEFSCNITQTIQLWTGLQPSDYYCIQNGRRVTTLDSASVRPDVPLRICERLPGGKGGFGSMLRAIGAQIEKTTNREACRDLSGRRLRDINEEKRLKAYLEKQEEADDGERVKAERKISKLLSKPKHEFRDREYEHARSELVVASDEAIQEGMQKAIALEMAQTEQESVTSAATSEKVATPSQSAESTRKRKHPEANRKVQAKKRTTSIWLSPEDLTSSSDSDDDTDSEGNNLSVGTLVAT